jgi:hypothetical protein
MSATTYSKQKVTEHMLGIANFTMPTSVYVALHTADPTISGSVAEVTGGSYARKLATFQWDSGNGWGENVALIRWDDLPAVTITHVSIKDALTSGNTLNYQAINIARAVGVGGSFEIKPQEITLTVS